MNNPSHIIDKVYIEVNTSSIEKAHEIKNNIGAFFQNRVFPKIEVLLNENDKQDTIVRIDKLNIDFSVGEQNYMDEISSFTCRQFGDRLKIASTINSVNSIQQEGIRRISKTNANEEIFLFFLKNGYLPWFGNEVYLDEISNNNQWKSKLKDAQFIAKIIYILKSQITAIDRLVLQFPPEMIISLLKKINQNIRLFIKEIHAFEKKLDSGFRKPYFKLLIQISVFDNKHRLDQISESVKLLVESDHGDDLKRLIHKLEPDVDLNEIDTHENSLDEPKSKKSFFEAGQNEIAVNNAGLILLHPFLKHFFRNIDVISPQDEIYKDKLALAVQSLHFLASGDENFFEGNLILEKFLCGLPLKFPLQRESLLADSIKKESEIVLNEVIKNWPVLKNTSADGLRQMFLQRDGKLIKTENGFKLIVERKAQDVLLDKINWNISMVKLPWINDLVFVEW